MKNDKKQYSAPELTVVSFRIEQGFGISDNKFHMILPGEITEGGNTYNNQGQQNWAAEQTPGGNIFGDTW